MGSVNPYAPPVEGAYTVIDRYPNPAATADKGKVTAAGVTLIVLGGLQLLLGLVVAAGMLRIRHSGLIGIGSIIEGGITLTCGAMTLRNSYGAAVTGLVFSCIGLALSILSFNIIGIAIKLIVVILVGRGVNAIKEINNRIRFAAIEQRQAAQVASAPRPAAAPKANPLVAYYHHFIRLLVHVMSADGHVDRRERQKIADFCDSMNISGYERERVIKTAFGQRLDVADETKRYLELAKEIKLPTPEWQLILAAVAVAGADGVIADAEAKAIREIGSALELTSGDVWTLLAEQEVDVDDLSADKARQLLGVSEGAGGEEVARAHETLSSELAKGDYSHLGQGFEKFVAQRQKVLDKARDVLG